MNRIDASLKALAQQGQKAFIPFITAGDPTLRLTAELVAELARVGADVIELGVPFSDPLADGVVNQEAAQRALRNNVSLRDILGMVRDLRRTCQVPLVLFTYFNPVLAYGIEAFAKDAASAGIDGVLCLDLPPEEAGDYKKRMNEHGLDTICLIAPTSTPERIRMIAQFSSGFIYYVSRTGVTGEQDAVESSVQAKVAAIKQYSSTPVAVGFGIAKPEQAAEVASYADGVVVGSAIVRLIGELGEAPGMVERVGAFVKILADAAKQQTKT